ncbi:efflux RND transporter periplasmic adaptor subunit [Tamlana sp. 2201CG12-4]|uniref:efflux RND transporter periplasmic adaptor subunit n=1 Tax=Tamlana sp. 2201CG12-4 TaxID=3112582 RepID=UPI002DB9C4E5|nr:efflux RND transporter periplasmic adaptor subunit [Tamlana sp. 2201CG12-4]MEC3906783.1 efflux RND transporter periplasmic adaptor subunit [Tamlana sp. 2201CG12-4]
MKYRIKLLLLVVVILVASCGKKKEEEIKVIKPISYQEVGYLGGEKSRTFSGTSRTDKVVNLSFRSAGIVTVFDIKIGQLVEKGQLLGKLDNVQARLNYENAVSSLNSAESEMNTSKLNLDRTRSLYEKGSSSLSDYESAKNIFRTASASHQSAKRTVAIQQDQITYGYLYAPEDGTIASISAEVNENVNAGYVVAVLNVSGDMEISLGLPESVINNVKQGMNVAISFSSIGSGDFKGQVSEVAPSIDASTSTYPVRVKVLNPTSEIRSGMAASVTFNFGKDVNNENVLVIPAKSVGEDDKGNFVFLINDKDGLGTVKKQHVKIGTLTSEGFQILEGLSHGEKIATAGLQTLLDGQEVKL